MRGFRHKSHLVVLALEAIGVAPVAVIDGVIGGEADGLVIIDDGALELRGRKSVGELRVKAEGRVVVGDGAVPVALVGVGITPVEVGPGVFRVEADGRVVVGDGAVQVALVGVGITRVEVGPGVFRIESDGLVVVGEGGVRSPFLS